MGYYTDFDFSDNRQDVIQSIEKQSGYGKSENGHYSQIKWYNRNKDLISVSLLFPSELIEINGEGEEQDDIWKAYFKNGKYVILHPEIVMPKFDETMLK